MSKKLLLAGVSVIALGAASVPADAAAIVANQWYTGHFTNPAGSPLFAGAYSVGTNGPILPTGFANAIAAPGSTTAPLSLTITLPSGGYLTVTDVEDSGDQFQMSVNGVLETAATGDPSGLGGQQAIGADTSVPVPGAAYCSENISTCLSNPDFSSGTFLLPAGTDTITGTFLGVIGYGDMDLIVEPASTADAPEPATLSILGAGLAAFGLIGRRRRRTGAV
jgi:hypothetical protein